MPHSAPASPASIGELRDVVGVGLGPSNLGLAIAIDEGPSRCAAH